MGGQNDGQDNSQNGRPTRHSITWVPMAPISDQEKPRNPGAFVTVLLQLKLSNVKFIKLKG